MPRGIPLPKAPPNLPVPDGEYSGRVVSAVQYGQLVCEITSQGKFKGQRFLLKMPQFYISVRGSIIEIKMGTKPYKPRGKA